MLRPHWLDDVFESPEQIAQFPNNPRFQAALVIAQAAFVAHEKVLQANPGIIGASSAQHARQAFLVHLKLQVTFPPEQPAADQIIC